VRRSFWRGVTIHPPTLNTHTHTHAHARAHAHTHTHTHAHTQDSITRREMCCDVHKLLDERSNDKRYQTIEFVGVRKRFISGYVGVEKQCRTRSVEGRVSGIKNKPAPNGFTHGTCPQTPNRRRHSRQGLSNKPNNSTRNPNHQRQHQTTEPHLYSSWYTVTHSVLRHNTSSTQTPSNHLRSHHLRSSPPQRQRDHHRARVVCVPPRGPLRQCDGILHQPPGRQRGALAV